MFLSFRFSTFVEIGIGKVHSYLVAKAWNLEDLLVPDELIER